MLGYILGTIIIISLIIGEIKWKILSQPWKNLKYLKIIILSFFLVLGVLFCLFVTDADLFEKIEYPLVNPVNTYHPYIEQFDAFQKGQLHIDYAPSQRLLELENPYDPASREGIYYLWDRALYNGKYYSYFGIGPIISVYYPYYFLTGSLPSDSLVVAIFLIITLLFLPLSIIEWAGHFTKKLPPALLSFGVISATLASNVLLISRGVMTFYYIASMSGMALLSLFLFFLERALYRQKRRKLNLALSGIAFSLLFLSRLNMALAVSFIIVPVIWFYLIRKPKGFYPLKDIIKNLICIGTPVIITFAFTFWFNNARFSSPFDFGTNYQLTVSDISQNKLRLSDLKYTLHHYFLLSLNPDNSYPYVTFSYDRLSNYGHYVYIDAQAALLTTPLMLALLLTPFLIISPKQSLSRRIILSCGMVGILFVAWLNFCIGGVIFRYTADLTIIASLISLFTLFIIFDYFYTGLPRRLASILSFVLVCFLGYSALTSLRISLITNGNLAQIPENVNEFLKLLLPYHK